MWLIGIAQIIKLLMRHPLSAFHLTGLCFRGFGCLTIKCRICNIGSLAIPICDRVLAVGLVLRCILVSAGPSLWASTRSVHHLKKGQFWHRIYSLGLGILIPLYKKASPALKQATGPDPRLELTIFYKAKLTFSYSAKLSRPYNHISEIFVS